MEESILLKDWVKHQVSDQVQQAQAVQRSLFTKQVNEIKKMFNVPGIIGDPTDSEVTNLGVERCEYKDYKSFIEYVHQADTDRQNLAEKN